MWSRRIPVPPGNRLKSATHVHNQLVCTSMLGDLVATAKQAHLVAQELQIIPRLPYRWNRSLRAPERRLQCIGDAENNIVIAACLSPNKSQRTGFTWASQFTSDISVVVIGERQGSEGTPAEGAKDS
ncbi:hypothetical protein B0H19DRAFT_1071964 [Mycena capillaripes]|nr:hypothetical protein B0H19DRAFT_1071964 [Mycena capillaripes]